MQWFGVDPIHLEAVLFFYNGMFPTSQLNLDKFLMIQDIL